ncbi:uncharacterized protein DC041_0005332 [Schistosoma bovis]|uniref:Uncharacterized protein n=1 Tax=Schistosoma bovis TaxID=6184 RepID=A0A430QLG8_SCHBO|nr:uncharacterized protein DC041_0005332 [Schistosoma bovis]
MLNNMNTIMKGFILLNLFLIYSRYCRTVHLGKSLKPKQFRPYNLTTHILISYEQELIKISRCNNVDGTQLLKEAKLMQHVCHQFARFMTDFQFVEKPPNM